jgi:hypothetical protein
MPEGGAAQSFRFSSRFSHDSGHFVHYSFSQTTYHARYRLTRGAAFMDMQRPDIETAEPPTAGACSRISRVALRCLLRILSTTLPVNSGDSAEIAAEKWELARELFFAMEPTNAIEAMLAARAVAAQFATLDLYARAAQSGMPDDKMLRLRAKAIAESRSSDAALRELDKRHAQAAKAAAQAAEDASRPRPERADADGSDGRLAVSVTAKSLETFVAARRGAVLPPGAT